MADAISIRITNLPEIKRAFSKAPQLMATNLNSAIRKTIIRIEGDSKMLTPVDTGTLRASHYSRFGTLRGEVGTNTEYDVFVHYGTRFMKPRPYLKTAVDKNSTQTAQYFTEAVQQTLDTIGKMT